MPTAHARRLLPLLAAVLYTLVPARAEGLRWSPLVARLPGTPSGPVVASQPLTLGNPLLQKINEKLYAVPWAPGEAVRIAPKPGAGITACGFWNGPGEYLLLVREGAGWRVVVSRRTAETPAGMPAPPGTAGRPAQAGTAETPAGMPAPPGTAGRPERPAAAQEPVALAYYGHEVSGQSVRWTGPARVVVAGPAGPEGVRVTRVPLFEAGCSLMVLERAERELRQARDCLACMQPPSAEVGARVSQCQARLDATRAELARESHGLLQSYQALPEPRYALENLAFFSRLHQRSKGFEKIGEPEAWTRVFYGRPEFAPCVEARRAAQEALWAQRPATLRAEVARLYGPQAGFGASLTHGLVKFRRDRPFPEPLRRSYRLCLAGDEFESFQVAVAALDKPLQEVTVSVQWQGAGPHPEVLLRPVGYVETRPDPDNLAEYVGWWPDPLLPPGPVQVAAHETQPLWGTVHATPATARGDHTATVTVSAAGQPPLKLTLTARVRSFNLGFTHLPSLLNLSFNSIKQFYRLEEVPQEVKRRWYAFCLQYRMNPNSIYSADFIPEEEDLDFCRERGLNAMVITTPALRRTTRNSSDNLQVFVSDDNQSFRRVPAGYTVSHGEGGSIVIAGLDVTARYLKAHSTLADEAYEFAFKTLERGRMTAYEGDTAYTGPAAYVGSEDGSKPLLSFDARWGAALDYRCSSLGVDLGAPRHVTRLVLQGSSAGTVERVKHFWEVAQAHGMADRAYVYGFDEWGDVARYGDIKTTYEELKRVAPGIKASSTVVHPVPPIDRTIDAWCPALCYEYPEYQAARQRGQEVWYYEGGCPYDPYPTHELLDVPAVEARAFFWVAWRYQYTGWLHWELNVWSNNLGGEKRWPQVPWNPARSGVRNGEVGRIYPGPEATPLPSVRLENMRDGIEDYDYFWLLREKARGLPAGSAQRLALEKLVDETILALCPSRAHFERDPQRVLALREKLGEALER